MSTPSIVPVDRLDRDFFVVLEDFRSGAAFCESDETSTYASLIDDLLSGQYAQVQRVVAFNPVRGWSRDASHEIARALENRLVADHREVPDFLRDFIEDQLGHKVGTRTALRLNV